MALLRALKQNSNFGKSAVSVIVIRDIDAASNQTSSKTNQRWYILSRIASRCLMIFMKWRDNEPCVWSDPAGSLQFL